MSPGSPCKLSSSGASRMEIGFRFMGPETYIFGTLFKKNETEISLTDFIYHQNTLVGLIPGSWNSDLGSFKLKLL